MIDVAYAQGSAAAAPGGGFSMLVPLVLMFLVFYFLLIRPQQKKQRKHQDMLKTLKVGDKVITTGGLCGTIVEGGETFLKLEIADKVRVEIGRGFIGGRITAKDAKDIPGPDGQPMSQGSGASEPQGGILANLAKLFKK
jgi:preprotein translocase subunit YajC